jgi:cell wall-associated NlpC family hydrolase
MSATKIAAAGSAILLVPVLIIIAAIAAVSTIFSGTAGSPSQTALADIPAGYLDLYIHAAALCPGLDWTILAAIGKVETDHGRSTLPGVSSGENSHGAGGVMQVLQPTWNTILAHHELPAGGATPPSRYNPHDAIFAAAFYLCDNGARDRRNLRGAIFAYNHDDSYVEHVLAQAARYARPVEACTAARPGPAPTTRPTATQPSPTALSTSPAFIAVAFACAQLGKPYVWGGNGEPGFDCSGLTHAAYAAAGMRIPRTAETQYNAGPHLPAGTPPQPGDLLFFGTTDKIHHVAMSLGGTQIIDAPTFGQAVQVQDYRDFPDYAGLTRPAPAMH